MKAFLYSAALATASLMWGCAGNTGSTAREPCALAAQDTVYLASGPVYRDCAVDEVARLLTQRTVPEFRPTNTRTSRCMSAEIQFVVSPLGVPETATARVVRSDDTALGEAMIRDLPQWRYQPAQKGGTAVRQIVRERRALTAVLTVVRVGAGGSVSPPPPPRPSC